MKKFLKVAIPFGILLFLYFVPALLYKSDVNYYNSLNKPFFAPPATLFGIAWPILYVLFSLYLAFKIADKTITSEVIFYFVVNYVISFFFNKVFFLDKNLFLSFVVTFTSCITGIFIFISTFKLGKNGFWFILPYIIWTVYASVLMANIYLTN